MDLMWKASDYRNAFRMQEGRIHIVSPVNPAQTRCGKRVADLGGGPTEAETTCRTCQTSAEAERARAERHRHWETANAQRQAEAKAAQEAVSAEWWAKYNAYLRTEKWRSKADAVLRRANRMCEACGVSTATQVHHTTYDHVGDEPLWELRAVCRPCHERITKRDREGRGRW